MEHRFNEPLYNEVFSITNGILRPINSEVYGDVPRTKKLRFSEHILPVPWPFVISRFHCTTFTICCYPLATKAPEIFKQKQNGSETPWQTKVTTKNVLTAEREILMLLWHESTERRPNLVSSRNFLTPFGQLNFRFTIMTQQFVRATWFGPLF